MITAQEVCTKQALNNGNEHKIISKVIQEIEKQIKEVSTTTNKTGIFSTLPYEKDLSPKGLQKVIGILGKHGYFASPYVAYRYASLYISWNACYIQPFSLPIPLNSGAVVLPAYHDLCFNDEVGRTPFKISDIEIPTEYWREMLKRTQKFDGVVNNFMWYPYEQQLSADYHFKTWYGAKGFIRVGNGMLNFSKHISTKNINNAGCVEDEINWYTQIIRRIIN